MNTEGAPSDPCEERARDKALEITPSDQLGGMSFKQRVELRERIASALRAERQEGRQEREAEIARLLSEISRLTRERDEARKDKERIDWLEGHTVEVREAIGHKLILGRTLGARPLREYIDETRAALDAARAKGGSR